MDKKHAGVRFIYALRFITGVILVFVAGMEIKEHPLIASILLLGVFIIPLTEIRLA